jgi:ABC-type microcin C transport system permease subunit YejB
MHRMHRYIVNRVLLLIPTLIGRDVGPAVLLPQPAA